MSNNIRASYLHAWLPEGSKFKSIHYMSVVVRSYLEMIIINEVCPILYPTKKSSFFAVTIPTNPQDISETSDDSDHQN